MFYGIYLERPSNLGEEMIISYSTSNHWSRGAAQAGVSSPARWLRCGGAAGRRRPCAHEGKEA
eukprot:6205718-Pleurochrysis_carterae.AAC.18